MGVVNSPPGSRRASRPRRTQSERSESTRSRVLASVVDCIVKDGLSRTHFAQISERAGVSVGSIQHQFGDKSELLIAVVESGFADLVREVARLQADSGSLRARLSGVVGTMWHHRSIPEAQAAFEILIQMRSDRAFSQRFVPHLARIESAMDQMWMGLFGELPTARANHVRARRLLFATLNGLATEKILLSVASEPVQELETLTESLHHILTTADIDEVASATGPMGSKGVDP
jgi:AcrR family transcriptional regulator